MIEEWRVVVSHPDYEVSNPGRVRRRTPGRCTAPGKIIKPLRTGAYLGVCLVSGGKGERRYIHRLVAAAFIGACPDRHEVNHKDGDKLNPAAVNLEYVTRSGNVRHALDIGLKVPAKGADSPLWKGGRPLKGRQSGERHWMHRRPGDIRRGEQCPIAKLTASAVEQIRKRVADGERQCDIATELSMSRAQISRIITGTRWSHL